MLIINVECDWAFRQSSYQYCWLYLLKQTRRELFCYSLHLDVFSISIEVHVELQISS